MSLCKPALPNVSGAVQAWSQPLVVVIVAKKQEDYLTKESRSTVKTRGAFMPMKTQQVVMKVEGERAWRWFSLFCSPTLELGTDDVVLIENVKCRVMGKKDFSQYGYFEYELIEDYRT